ncbi:MAG: 6-hydroxymethylpterin diphosphokinase MptE-like protein [Desulfurococcaceae archaeon]
MSKILLNMSNVITADLLFERIRGRSYAIVVGCGPNAQKEAQLIRRIKERNFLLVAADGATKILLDCDITPDLIVTDLDGNLEALLDASKNGAIVVFHAHGDNIERIDLIKKFKGPVVGSTQVEPRPFVYNFGGFTDGDRAIFILQIAGYRRVYVSGFDFEIPYSCPGKEAVNYNIKKVKLYFAKRLISMLQQKGIDIQEVRYLFGGSSV